LDFERRIEEGIAELIRLELGIEVGPEKHEIKRALKSRGMDLEELLGIASRDNLREAFPSLCSALEEIEKLIS